MCLRVTKKALVHKSRLRSMWVKSQDDHEANRQLRGLTRWVGRRIQNEATLYIYSSIILGFFSQKMTPKVHFLKYLYWLIEGKVTQICKTDLYMVTYTRVYMVHCLRYGKAGGLWSPCITHYEGSLRDLTYHWYIWYIMLTSVIYWPIHTVLISICRNDSPCPNGT